MTNLIFACIALVVFLVYNTLSIYFYDIPANLSDTFYLYRSSGVNKWGNKGRVLGYIFPLVMFSMVFLLMPAWLEMTYSSGILIFIMAASIVFVGVTPIFSNAAGVEDKIHKIAATICTIVVIAWSLIISSWLGLLITLLTICVTWLVGYITEYMITWRYLEKIDVSSIYKQPEYKRDHLRRQAAYLLKGDSVYWWEMCALTAMFVVVITQSIINI